MAEQFLRTELLLGRTALEKLAASRVAVFGIGGVGGYVVEALARSGVGTLDLIDSDVVSPSNINRQIIATRKTVGKFKPDPAAFEVADIYETSVCPLAKVMRHELKRRGIKSLKVVYSKEKPLKPLARSENDLDARRQVPGSVPFVPPVAGLIIAGEVVKDLIS